LCKGFGGTAVLNGYGVFVVTEIVLFLLRERRVYYGRGRGRLGTT
jgi:hypothetical protein